MFVSRNEIPLEEGKENSFTWTVNRTELCFSRKRNETNIIFRPQTSKEICLIFIVLLFAYQPISFPELEMKKEPISLGE